MKIENIKLLPPKKRHQLAVAELMLSDGSHTVLIRDLRVLQGKNGLWLGEPEHTVPASGPAKYEYQRTVEFGPALKKDIFNAVLNAYKAKAHAESQST